jgi:hypothetical protein
MGREHERSRPSYFRGCDLTAEYLPATEEVRVQFPTTAPAFASSTVADKGCRVETSGAKTDFHGVGDGLRLGRPIPISRAPARAAESPKLSLPGAAPGRLANSSWGRGRKVMHLPCKQAQAGALPAVLHHFTPTSDVGFNLRETRPKHREKPHKLLQVGATPTPATSLRSKQSESETAAP